MKATEKGPEGPVTAAAGEKSDVVESAVRIYATGVERLAEAQKKSIDLATEHNAEMVKTWKKLAVGAPGLFMVDLAATAFDRFAETHKAMIDLVVEQTHTLTGAGEGAQAARRARSSTTTWREHRKPSINRWRRRRRCWTTRPGIPRLLLNPRKSNSAMPARPRARPPTRCSAASRWSLMLRRSCWKS